MQLLGKCVTALLFGCAILLISIPMISRSVDKGRAAAQPTYEEAHHVSQEAGLLTLPPSRQEVSSVPLFLRNAIGEEIVINAHQTSRIAIQQLHEENVLLRERIADLEEELMRIRLSNKDTPYIAFLLSTDVALCTKQEKSFVREILWRFPVQLMPGEALALKDLTEECSGPGKNCDEQIIQILGPHRLVQELSDEAKAFLRRDLNERHLALLGMTEEG
jgi:hypothetical protein